MGQKTSNRFSPLRVSHVDVFPRTTNSRFRALLKRLQPSFLPSLALFTSLNEVARRGWDHPKAIHLQSNAQRLCSHRVAHIGLRPLPLNSFQTMPSPSLNFPRVWHSDSTSLLRRVILSFKALCGATKKAVFRKCKASTVCPFPLSL